MKRLLILFFLILSTVQIAQSQTITTIAGTGSTGIGGDGGPATAAQLNKPYGIAFNSSGEMYLTCPWGHGVRKISTSGVITTLAGLGSSIAYNGEPATSAYLIRPAGITCDNAGNYYFTDMNINLVFKVTAAGNIYKIAGNTTTGYTGDGGQATLASLNSPTDILLDSVGNLYFSDAGNNVVRKVSTAGIITTIAGNGSYGFSGDGGPATAAKLWSPSGLTFDTHGNLCIGDAVNHRVRKIDAAGTITTIAGGGSGVNCSPATAVSIGAPTGIAFDSQGNLFITDNWHSFVYMVDTNGILCILAGTGVAGYSGDGGPATAAEVNQPCGLALNSSDVYLADQVNERIRRIHRPPLTTPALSNTANDLTISPNPNNGVFVLEGTILSGSSADGVVEIYDIWGRRVYSDCIRPPELTHEITVGNLADGSYFLHVRNSTISKVLHFEITK